MDEFLKALQQVDPLWSVVLVAAALGVLLVAKLWRTSFVYVLAGLLTFVVVGAVAAGGYYGYTYMEDQRRLEERRALEARAEVLFTKRIEADSIYACIDGSPAPAMLEGCERTLFAEPQRVAAAVAIVTQRLVFLGEAVAFATERDPSYSVSIAPMRNAIEADPYGFVAFVLSVEHGCTHDACQRFKLFRDPARVRENMRVRRFEAFIAKHQPAWRGSSELPEDSAPTVGARTSAPLVTISGDPSAASPPEETTSVPGAAVAPPVISVPAVPMVGPMVTPPSAASVAAEPPAAATAPTLQRPVEEGFTQPPAAATSAPEPAAAKGAGQAKGTVEAKGAAEAKGPGEAKGAPRTPSPSQAKAKAKAVDPISRRSSEPVAGLPRVVPSDYKREQEEKEAATAQSNTRPQPGAPVEITPPRQNFTGN